MQSKTAFARSGNRKTIKQSRAYEMRAAMVDILWQLIELQNCSQLNLAISKLCASSLQGMLHWQSATFGAGISAASMLVVFSVLGSIETQPEELKIVDAPQPRLAIDLFLANSSPALGSADAGITLVEFGDYQCVACSRFFHETEKSLIENYVNTGAVRLVFKDFTIIGQDSVYAAHASHCASEQNMFWEYHDILYTNWDGENTGWASLENLRLFAQEINLDTESWDACMSEGRYEDKIRSSNEDAINLGLPGTPSFFVINSNGEVAQVVGPQPLETFERTFEAMSGT